MATVSPKRATIDDLLKTEGKGELIGGRVVRLMPTGFLPNRIAASSDTIRRSSIMDLFAMSPGRYFTSCTLNEDVRELNVSNSVADRVRAACTLARSWRL